MQLKQNQSRGRKRFEKCKQTMLQGRIMQDQEMCTTHSGRIGCLTDRIPDQ